MKNRFFIASMFIMLTGSTIVSAKNINPAFEAIDLNQDRFISSGKFQIRNILPARLIAPDKSHLSELGPAEYSIAQVQGQEEGEVIVSEQEAGGEQVLQGQEEEGTVPEQEAGGEQVLQGQEEEGTVPEQEAGGEQVLQGQEQETGEGQVLQGYEEDGKQNGTAR